jgi:TPR repeat protein
MSFQVGSRGVVSVLTFVSGSLGIWFGSLGLLSSSPSSQCSGKDDARTSARAEALREALQGYRHGEAAMRARWDLDEETKWRQLPARAWPEKQPDAVDVPDLKNRQCAPDDTSPVCSDLAFQLATGLLFNHLDMERGFAIYRNLADRGHVDGMVAVGILLTEGLGVQANEMEGVEWLRRGCAAGSTQALYELGSVYYTGLSGVVEEDEARAFEMFANAAEKHHVGACFMVADMLLDGTGVKQDLARAIPLLFEVRKKILTFLLANDCNVPHIFLLYQAAENGHRFARQKARSLLDEVPGE